MVRMDTTRVWKLMRLSLPRIVELVTGRRFNWGSRVMPTRTRIPGPSGLSKERNLGRCVIRCTQVNEKIRVQGQTGTFRVHRVMNMIEIPISITVSWFRSRHHQLLVRSCGQTREADGWPITSSSENRFLAIGHHSMHYWSPPAKDQNDIAKDRTHEAIVMVS